MCSVITTGGVHKQKGSASTAALGKQGRGGHHTAVASNNVADSQKPHGTAWTIDYMLLCRYTIISRSVANVLLVGLSPWRKLVAPWPQLSSTKRCTNGKEEEEEEVAISSPSHGTAMLPNTDP